MDNAEQQPSIDGEGYFLEDNPDMVFGSATNLDFGDLFPRRTPPACNRKALIGNVVTDPWNDGDNATRNTLMMPTCIPDDDICGLKTSRVLRVRSSSKSKSSSNSCSESSYSSSRKKKRERESPVTLCFKNLKDARDRARKEGNSVVGELDHLFRVVMKEQERIKKEYDKKKTHIKCLYCERAFAITSKNNTSKNGGMNKTNYVNHLLSATSCIESREARERGSIKHADHTKAIAFIKRCKKEQRTKKKSPQKNLEPVSLSQQYSGSGPSSPSTNASAPTDYTYYQPDAPGFGCRNIVQEASDSSPGSTGGSSPIFAMGEPESYEQAGQVLGPNTYSLDTEGQCTHFRLEMAELKRENARLQAENKRLSAENKAMRDNHHGARPAPSGCAAITAASRKRSRECSRPLTMVSPRGPEHVIPAEEFERRPPPLFLNADANFLASLPREEIRATVRHKGIAYNTSLRTRSVNPYEFHNRRAPSAATLLVDLGGMYDFVDAVKGALKQAQDDFKHHADNLTLRIECMLSVLEYDLPFCIEQRWTSTTRESDLVESIEGSRRNSRFTGISRGSAGNAPREDHKNFSVKFTGTYTPHGSSKSGNESRASSENSCVSVSDKPHERYENTEDTPIQCQCQTKFHEKCEVVVEQQQEKEMPSCQLDQKTLKIWVENAVKAMGVLKVVAYATSSGDDLQNTVSTSSRLPEETTRQPYDMDWARYIQRFRPSWAALKLRRNVFIAQHTAIGDMLIMLASSSMLTTQQFTAISSGASYAFGSVPELASNEATMHILCVTQALDEREVSLYLTVLQKQFRMKDNTIEVLKDKEFDGLALLTATNDDLLKHAKALGGINGRMLRVRNVPNSLDDTKGAYKITEQTTVATKAAFVPTVPKFVLNLHPNSEEEEVDGRVETSSESSSPASDFNSAVPGAVGVLVEEDSLLDNTDDRTQHAMYDTDCFESVEDFYEELCARNNTTFEAMGRERMGPTAIFSRETLNRVIVDRERIKKLRMVGRGMFGSAYLVMLDGREVVAKETNADWHALMELEAMLKLPKHPNVVDFIGLSIDRGTAWFIIDFCERGSLNALHHKIDMRHPEAFKAIATDVVKGLNHLHDHGVVHRDIACRNLFMRKDGSVVVGDLGLTRGVKDKEKGYTGTSWKLPWRWMPPEVFVQARDGRVVPAGAFSFESDIWMLGVAMWEVLTQGQKPYGDAKSTTKNHHRDFQQDTVIGISRGQIKLQVPSSATYSQSKMVKGCLSYYPDERPSLSELAEIINLELSNGREWQQAGDSNSSKPLVHHFFRLPGEKRQSRWFGLMKKHQSEVASGSDAYSSEVSDADSSEVSDAYSSEVSVTRSDSHIAAMMTHSESPKTSSPPQTPRGGRSLLDLPGLKYTVPLADLAFVEEEGVLGCIVEIKGKSYRVKKLLAKSIFGAVWRAETVGDEEGVDVALKVSDVSTKASLEDPESEAAIMKRLGCYDESCHRNLIRCHAWEREANSSVCAAVLTFVSEGDLFGFVNPGEGLNWPLEEKVRRDIAAASVIRQILEGVSNMHKRNIAHLDLSLENVLVCREKDKSLTSSLVPKICDFGMSRDLSVSSSRYMDGSPGKRTYMAPEVSLGKFDAKLADSYSVGIMTFILLTGHPPYQFPKPQDVLFKLIFRKGEKGLRTWLRHYRKIGGWSESAIKFVSKLLCPENNRMSVEEALCSNFIQQSIKVQDLKEAPSLPW